MKTLLTAAALLVAFAASAHAGQLERPTVSREIPVDFVGDWCFEFNSDISPSDDYVLPSWNNEACTQQNKIVSIQPYYMGDQREDRPRIDCNPVRVWLRHTCAPSGCGSVGRVECDGATYFSLYRYKGHLSIERIRRDDDQFCEAKANFMSAARIRHGECKFEDSNK